MTPTRKRIIDGKKIYRTTYSSEPPYVIHTPTYVVKKEDLEAIEQEAAAAALADAERLAGALAYIANKTDPVGVRMNGVHQYPALGGPSIKRINDTANEALRLHDAAKEGPHQPSADCCSRPVYAAVHEPKAAKEAKSE